MQQLKEKQTLNQWENWVKPDILDDLQSNAWNQVTNGLDKLKKQWIFILVVFM